MGVMSYMIVEFELVLINKRLMSMKGLDCWQYGASGSLGLDRSGQI